MFWHSFKYGIKTTIRNKSQMFWSFVFVIILGTLFQSTFGNAYETDIVSGIRVAAYIDDEAVRDNVSGIIENITVGENDEKLFMITYCDSLSEAEEKLEDSEIEGLIYSENGELKLKLKENGISESILASMVGRYHQITAVMKNVSTMPAELQGRVISILMGGEIKNTDKSFSDGKMNVFIQYFYNLLAMTCLMASSAGVNFAIENQGNLSSLGARKNLAGSNSVSRTLGGLIAEWLLLTVTSILAFGYLVLIGVEFGNKIPAILLILLIGNLLGISAGYFVGSIGSLSRNVKETFSTLFSVFTCFLSGLMILDIRMVIEQKCPVINDINPAVWISDAFYSLMIYDNYDRYWNNIMLIAIGTAIFVIGGIILGRRKNYASV